MMRICISLAALLLPLTAPAFAETPRETLTMVAFGNLDKASALAATERAHLAAGRLDSRREALLMKAMATGYRAKLTNSRSEAVAARRAFEVAASSNPGDPEALASLGSWHISAVTALGGMAARIALGAERAKGLEALGRSIALGGNRALFVGNAALLRVKLDSPTPEARRLAVLAASAPAPTALDRHMKDAAAKLLATWDNAGAVRTLAGRLLPLGRFEK